MSQSHSVRPAFAMYAVALAVVLPTSFAIQWLPSATALNSLVSVAAWGVALVLIVFGRLPMAGLAVALAIGVLLWAVHQAVIGFVQVFVPPSPSNEWMAVSSIVSRATGNLRQPNLLGTVLLWGVIAGVALSAWFTGLRDVRNLARMLGTVILTSCVLLLTGTVVLTGSRTALLLGLPVLVLWGLLDRQLPPLQRAMLLALPLVAGITALGLHWWGDGSGRIVGAEARLGAEGMASVSRWRTWADAWALIQGNPLGVGLGEFNRAWTLTPLPDRAPHFFDHTHNLVLQLVVELGWVVGGALVIGFVTLFSVATSRAVRSSGPDALPRRASVVGLSVVGVHSLLEYPLWYPYLLLPTLVMAAIALWPTEVTLHRWPASLLRRLGAGTGLLMVVATGLAWHEYRIVNAIYAPNVDARPLNDRIAAGYQTVFFSSQAAYAAATALSEHPMALEAAERASHLLIDTRLLIAWAKNLHAAGQTDKARYLVARLQEFRKPDGDAWMAECEAAPTLWHCSPPQGAYTWRDF